MPSSAYARGQDVASPGAAIGLTEHEIGKGTLAYHGETAEYYESKRGIWDVARWILAAILLALGAAFLVASWSPVVPATVVTVTDNGVSGTNQVVLQAPDGATSTTTLPYADTPAVGSTLDAMELPGGRLVPGDYTVQGRGTGVLFLLLGVGVVLRAVWSIRHPHPPVTTVLAPDDAYDRHPLAS